MCHFPANVTKKCVPQDEDEASKTLRFANEYPILDFQRKNGLDKRMKTNKNIHSTYIFLLFVCFVLFCK